MPQKVLLKRTDVARFSNRAIRIVVCALSLLLFAALGHAQISPGPIAKPHESLSGPLSCTKCHEFGRGASQLKCLDCHTEIHQEVTQRRGMHAVWLAQNATGKDCVSCHSDHNGTDFALIHWQPNREALDHSKTGFALTGRHATAGCNDCHKAANIAAAARSGILIKDLNHTYLGLSPDCLSCHADEHRGQLGHNCESCHTTSAWQPAPGFNHATTKYPLTGAHATVACAKCHVSVPGRQALREIHRPCVQQMHSLPYGSTQGQLRRTCQSCHNTVAWTRVAQMEGFDHAKTNFPLLGKHATVACSDCHTHGDFKTPVAHAKCADCHNPDPHKGQFQSRSSKGECAECHTVDGWKPSLFDVKAHATSAYPLMGKHASVECGKCHVPARADTVFKVAFEHCTDCHQDAHDGQFAKAPYQNRCESCHTVNDFHRSKFTIAMHRDTRFPLEGAHAVVPCIACHKEGAAGRIDKILPFHFEDRSCTACHADPHHGQFKARMAEKGANGAALGCEACHNVNSWTDAKGFDHSKTEFPLVGAHRAVSCSSCHLIPAGAHEAVFKGTAKTCEVCHADVHAGQFAQDDRTHCADCHTSERWAPSTFDHDKRTSFPLTGGHANVACDKCHTQTRAIDGEAVVFYRLAPTECAACHGTRDSLGPPGTGR